jgi:exopolysaccharide biosynthesis polyprenyl glycosylphosphotransferase
MSEAEARRLELRGSSPEAALGGGLALESDRRSLVASRWGRRDRTARRWLAVADALALLAALAAATNLADQRTDNLALLALGALTLPIWILLFKLYGLYDREVKRITHTALDDLPWLFHAVLVGGFAFWGLVRLTSIDQMPLLEWVLFAGLALAFIVVARSAAARIHLAWLGPERVLLVGDGPVVGPLERILGRHPEFGLAPIGILSDSRPGHDAERADQDREAMLPWLGAVGELEAVVAREAPDRVFVCRAAFEADQVLEVVDTCRRYSLKVGILPDALESFGPSVEIDEIHGIAVLGISPPVLNRTSRLIKRGFDLFVAALTLILTAPLFALAALAVRLSGPGPVIFRQSRVGRGGERFELLKFRTMVVDAEERREELMEESSEHEWLALEHDPRITRVGAWLRRGSIDELPQLVNVLRGEMSLVGPRPLPEEEDRQVRGWARGRLDLVPGITGLWQVLGRTRIPFEEMVKLDYLYVTNWSLWLDLRLMLRTLPALLSRRGVN